LTLSRLSRADYALLEPHLHAVELPVRKQLAIRNKRIQQVYFLESGVANGESNIEVGIIGRDSISSFGE
jgi:hypothetical protein